MAYEREGHGEPLVLLPGTAATCHYWGPLRPALARDHDVIAVDLPGHGDTPPLPRGLAATDERLAAAVAGLLDELAIDRAHLVGNSLGGQVALELARMGRARSVCALSPAGFWTARERLYCIAVLRFSAAAGARLLALPPWLAGGLPVRTLLACHLIGRPWRVPRADYLDALAHTAATPGLEAVFAGYRTWRAPLPHELDHIPITIAWGDRDLLLPLRQAKRARAVLPNARHVTLKGCGHVPWWDDTDQVVRVVRDAVRE